MCLVRKDRSVASLSVSSNTPPLRKCNTVTYGLNSFRYQDAKIWNNLPNEITNSITLAEFKNQIKNGKEQSVFAICVQDCYRMQLI